VKQMMVQCVAGQCHGKVQDWQTIIVLGMDDLTLPQNWLFHQQAHKTEVSAQLLVSQLPLCICFSIKTQ
jgi:hypothetical protein